MTIRQSGFGSLEPTRQITAQRYKASVVPAPRQLSGLEKLAEFGMQFLQYKHQIDQEVLQADLSIAVEKYEDAIKGMDPSDFAKDPEAALKAAGINDLYGLIEKAPIGRQSEIRKKIDYLRDKTTTSMTAAHDTREKVRAAVYNTSNELRTSGDVSPEHWESVMALKGDAQQHAIASMAQIAITEGRMELFDRMAQDQRLAPELHDNVEVWKRQAQSMIDAKKREEEAAARRRAIEANKAHKEALKAQRQMAVLGMLSQGTPMEVVMSLAPINDGVKRDEVEWAVRSNPALHRTVAATSVLNTDKHLMAAMFANPVSPDGKTPSPTFQAAANTLQMYLDVRGGVDALEGVGLTKTQRQAVQAALMLSRKSGEDFAGSLYRSLTTATPYMLPVNSADERKRDSEVIAGFNMTQRDAYKREKESLMHFGLSPAEASEKAAEYVTADAHNANGVTITGITGVRNMLGETLGVHIEDKVLNEVINTTIDKTLTNASNAYFGSNQPLDKWHQFTDMDGTLIFQHKDHFGLMVQVTPDMFKKTASEFKQQDVAYGKDEPSRRTEHADQYERVGAGYPVRKLKNVSSNPFESFFR